MNMFVYTREASKKVFAFTVVLALGSSVCQAGGFGGVKVRVPKPHLPSPSPHISTPQLPTPRLPNPATRVPITVPTPSMPQVSRPAFPSLPAAASQPSGPGGYQREMISGITAGASAGNQVGGTPGAVMGGFFGAAITENDHYNRHMREHPVNRRTNLSQQRQPSSSAQRR